MLLPTNKEVMWMNNFIYKSRDLWIKSKMRESPKTKNAPQLSERHFGEVPSGLISVHSNRYNYPQIRIRNSLKAHYPTLVLSNT